MTHKAIVPDRFCVNYQEILIFYFLLFIIFVIQDSYKLVS